VNTGYERLDFERFPIAFRVVALAGQLGCLFRIGTYIAAVILSGRSRTVTSRVFAFLCRGHESSSYLNMPSLLRRLCCALRQLHTSRCNYAFRSLTAGDARRQTRWAIPLRPSLSRTAQIPNLNGEDTACEPSPCGSVRDVNLHTRHDSLLGLLEIRYRRCPQCGELKQHDGQHSETSPPRSSTMQIASTTPNKMVLDRLDDSLG
jgi:hypothetical protein